MGEGTQKPRGGKKGAIEDREDGDGGDTKMRGHRYRDCTAGVLETAQPCSLGKDFFPFPQDPENTQDMRRRT